MHVRRESAFILGRKTCASLQRLSETQKSLKMRIPSLRQFMNASEGKKDLNEQVRILKGRPIASVPSFPLCHFRQLFPAFHPSCDRAPLPRAQTQYDTDFVRGESLGEQDRTSMQVCHKKLKRSSEGRREQNKHWRGAIILHSENKGRTS